MCSTLTFREAGGPFTRAPMCTAVLCTSESIAVTSGADGHTTAFTQRSGITQHFMAGASSPGECRLFGVSEPGVGEARGGVTTAGGGHHILSMQHLTTG